LTLLIVDLPLHWNANQNNYKEHQLKVPNEVKLEYLARTSLFKSVGA